MYVPPSEFSKFDIHRGRLPASIRKTAKDNLIYMDKKLHSKLVDISIVRDVVALPFGRGWKYSSADEGVNLFVSGSFRSEYRAIVTMAEVLEDFYVETLYLPRIFPMKKSFWKEQMEFDTGLYRAIRHNGITSYSEHLHYG
ncbi:hypothetical protein ACFL6F_03000 [Planctomycetota bacterium]